MAGEDPRAGKGAARAPERKPSGLDVQLQKLSAYAPMKRDEDMRVPAAQALFQRAQSLELKWAEASSWSRPELLQIPEARLKEWLRQPDLSVYRHFFDMLLRVKEHILSRAEGGIAGDVGQGG